MTMLRKCSVSYSIAYLPIFGWNCSALARVFLPAPPLGQGLIYYCQHTCYWRLFFWQQWNKSVNTHIHPPSSEPSASKDTMTLCQWVIRLRWVSCLWNLTTVKARGMYRAAVGIEFQSPYPSHSHRKKPVGIPTEFPYPQNPEILHTYTPHLAPNR